VKEHPFGLVGSLATRASRTRWMTIPSALKPYNFAKAFRKIDILAADETLQGRSDAFAQWWWREHTAVVYRTVAGGSVAVPDGG
jgi:hypothetical protein